MARKRLKIIGYGVVSDANKDAFVQKVKEVIAIGWEPHGQMIIDRGTGNILVEYVQPIIKYAEK